MNISFVIPVLNREDLIRQCLESILSEAGENDEIIVVDNGSTDNTANIVREYGKIDLYIYPELTVSALRNRGVAESHNELLAFIDSDCTLCPGWQDAVMKTMADDTIHAAGALYEVPEDAGWFEKAWFSQKPDTRTRAKYINTGNLVIRRSVFDESGGFNEKLVTDEDCEFGERLNRMGYYMLENPEIRVTHHGNPTTVREFYIREKWHATSVLESGSLDVMNLPNIMTMAFGISLVLGLASVVAAVSVSMVFLWGILAIAVVPVMTAVYRARQFGIYRYIAALALLWGVFYVVRVHNIFLHATRPREASAG